MIVQTSTTNMEGWMSSGWRITPELVPEVLIPQSWPEKDGNVSDGSESEADGLAEAIQ